MANISECYDKDLCSRRHTANSMRIGIVQKLRKGFEEVGRRGPFIPATCEGDPTNSVLVNEYIAFKHREQGEAGVAPKSARTMYRFKMDLLMENMRLTIKGKRGILKLRLAERRAMYAYCFSAIKRRTLRIRGFGKIKRFPIKRKKASCTGTKRSILLRICVLTIRP